MSDHPYPREPLWSDDAEQIAALRRWLREKEDEIARLQAEIDRLRKSLDDHLDSEAAETRRADRERDGARKAAAEIERLRFMLSETLPYFGLQTVAHNLQVPHPLGIRIRKVLGDVPDA